MMAALVNLMILSGISNAQFDMQVNACFEPFIMLQRPAIRKEIGLSREQSVRIDSILKTMQFNVASRVRLNDSDEVRGNLLALLEEKQMRRYSEILFQAKGAIALSDKEVELKLALTGEQKNAIIQIRKLAAKDALAKFHYWRGGQNPFEEASNNEEKDLMALLTIQQKAIFAKLGGRAFKDARQKGCWPI